MTSTCTYTDADHAYIRANYFTLSELCGDRTESPEEVRELIDAGALPAAAYVLDDGSEWFPAGFFDLADEAGQVERLHHHFGERLRVLGMPDQFIDEVWEEYLSGGLFWCIRDVTPDSIVRKASLCDAITKLLAQPAPAEAVWCAALRRDVWALDAIEREFAPNFDRDLKSGGIRTRFGVAPSRDRLVELPRRLYPEVFDVEAARTVA